MKKISREECEKEVERLGIKSNEEWRRAYRAGIISKEFPYTLINQDWWIGRGDFFNTTQWINTTRVLNFEAGRILAREFSKKYEISNSIQYRAKYLELYKMDDFPKGMSISPFRTYKNKGWQGWADWLGNGKMRSRSGTKKPIEECVKYIQSLNIQSNQEWKNIVKGKDFPRDIYSDLSQFEKRGYVGKVLFGFQFNDTLECVERHSIFGDYNCVVIKARAFAVERKITSGVGWTALGRSGIPKELPVQADIVYAGKGWKGWADWIGITYVGRFSRTSGDEIIDEAALKEKLESSVVTREIINSSIPEDSKEEWKNLDNIGGWKGRKGIHVSTYGRVYDACKKKFLTLIKIGGGRCGKEWGKHHLAVSAGQASSMVHRLVAMAFIPNPENKPIVNHIDGNPENNIKWNLEWVTARENNYHAILTGSKKGHSLSREQAYEVKLLLATGKHRISHIAEVFKVATSVINQINAGGTYKYVGVGEFTYPIKFIKRSKRIDNDTRTKVREFLKNGLSFNQISEITGLSKSTIILIRDNYNATSIPEDSLKYLHSISPLECEDIS